MEKLTYKQAYNKIIDAYFKDEIRPMSPKFCFCGTLAPDFFWAAQLENSEEYPYSTEEYRRMEQPLVLSIGAKKSMNGDWIAPFQPINTPEYEENVFKGMCGSLEELKKIHIERGENVDEVPTFTKRSLKTA